MANKAEAVSPRDGPDRVDALKELFFAITKSVNSECKANGEDYWKEIDRKIHEV